MSNAKPNVIIILTDDQGFGDLACHGNPVALTPQLDKLHGESIRLNDFHAAPMCTPTRGQMMTGLDAARNGAINVSSGRSLLRADLPTMADMFLANGYRTGLFGKWHLGDNYPYRPQDRGFEETLWFPSSHISSLPDYWENDYFDDIYCKNGKRERYEGYCTEVFFREAKTWMKECVESEEPFFVYLPTNAPHAPFYVPSEDRKAIEEVFAEHGGEFELEEGVEKSLIRFLAMIRNLDTQVGTLRDFMKEEGIEENTILLFMTDNGSTFGNIYYNAGMKGSKCSLWEGGHRVPCFINWPEGGLGEARDIEGLTEFQDILPTLIDLCKLDVRDKNFDGISLAPVLSGKAEVDKDRMLMINYSRMPNTDYPTPDSKSIMRKNGAAVCWRRWRLLEEKELYNLDSDPLQEKNIINEHPDVAQKMQKAFERWWEDVEPVANVVQKVIIGSDKENPMMLTACEWQDVFVDQQGQVRWGEQKNGYWNLEVEQAGTYTFELFRWPVESGLKLTEASPAADLEDGHLDEGVSMPIAAARILISREDFSVQVGPEDTSAVFTVGLEAGPTLLHTWFYDDKNHPLCGAYYVNIERIACS